MKMGESSRCKFAAAACKKEEQARKNRAEEREKMPLRE
jgi:hypothetical protein